MQVRAKEGDEDEKAHLKEQLEILMLTLEGKQRREEQVWLSSVCINHMHLRTDVQTAVATAHALFW